jgi:hypothetical protein
MFNTRNLVKTAVLPLVVLALLAMVIGPLLTETPFASAFLTAFAALMGATVMIARGSDEVVRSIGSFTPLLLPLALPLLLARLPSVASSLRGRKAALTGALLSGVLWVAASTAASVVSLAMMPPSPDRLSLSVFGALPSPGRSFMLGAVMVGVTAGVVNSARFRQIMTRAMQMMLVVGVMCAVAAVVVFDDPGIGTLAAALAAGTMFAPNLLATAVAWSLGAKVTLLVDDALLQVLGQSFGSVVEEMFEFVTYGLVSIDSNGIADVTTSVAASSLGEGLGFDAIAAAYPVLWLVPVATLTVAYYIGRCVAETNSTSWVSTFSTIAGGLFATLSVVTVAGAISIGAVVGPRGLVLLQDEVTVGFAGGIFAMVIPTLLLTATVAFGHASSTSATAPRVTQLCVGRGRELLASARAQISPLVTQPDAVATTSSDPSASGESLETPAPVS